MTRSTDQFSLTTEGVTEQELRQQLAEAQQARADENAAFNTQQQTLKEVFRERDTYARLLREVVMAWAQLRSHVTEVDLEGETDFERAVLEMERVYAALKAAKP